MAEPNLIEQERVVIRKFCEATASRTSSKKRIEWEFEQRVWAVKQSFDQTREQIADSIAQGESLLSEVHDYLMKRGWNVQLSAGNTEAIQGGNNTFSNSVDYFARAKHAFADLKSLVATQDNRHVISTLGVISVIVGAVSLLLFVSSLLGGSLSLICYLFVGVAAIVVGLLLINRFGRGGLDTAVHQRCKLLSQAIATHIQSQRQRSAQVEKAYQHQLADLQKVQQDALQALQHTSRQELLELGGSSLVVGYQVNKVSLTWSAPDWTQWSVATSVPTVTRMGDLGLSAYEGTLSFPALYGFPKDRSLLFKASGAARPLATEGIQSLLLRLLATIPPGKVRFIFIDPVGRGQNVSSFMQLAEYDTQLVIGKAKTEPQHIEDCLAELTEHIDTVSQKYLRKPIATIEDYNTQAGEVAEPYRILVVFDFPTNFSPDAVRRLVGIVQSGLQCGVFTILLVDADKPLPNGFSQADLAQHFNVIAWDGNRFVWQDEDFKHCTLVLDTLPDAVLMNRIVQTIGAAGVEASKVEVPFDRVAPTVEQYWTDDSRAGLRAALGPSGARKLQYLDLGKGTSQHALVVGKTGSGKSNLLHVLITNLALTYSPDEVALYLIDFKKGIEFKSYATHRLPHARVIAIESEREFGLSTLQGLDAELKRRGDLFRGAGVDGLADYRQKQGDKVTLPRILLLVDEFQEFFTEDDAIASQSAQILDRLVRQGRAFGIHVLLGSQTLAGSYTLARSTIDQMAVRIALQCSEADSRLILADDNPAARRLSRPGEAIYNNSNGLLDGNNPFQVVLLPDEQRDRYLGQINALAQARGHKPSQPQLVFEGNAPAEVEKNALLSGVISAPPPTTPSRAMRAWIGEPIAIKEPTATSFRRQSGSNLLIVGQNDEAALGMMTTALVSLAAQSPVSNARSLFYVLDFGAVDGPHAEFFDRLADHMKPAFTTKVGRRRQLPDTINDLEAEVKRRMNDETSTQSGAKPSIYLFVYGFHRARDLRQEDSFAFSPIGQEPTAPNPGQQFTTILREGPDLGVHTIVWCDTLTNLNRGLDRRALREFAMRIAFQMSAEDSANLIDTPAASKLGQYRALFYSEEEGRLEKFRPYGLPSESWLSAVAQQLAKRPAK